MEYLDRLIGYLSILLLFIIFGTSSLFAQVRYTSTIADGVMRTIQTEGVEPIDLSPNPYLLPLVFPDSFLFKTTIDNPPLIKQKKTFPALQSKMLIFTNHSVVDTMRFDAFHRYVANHPGKAKYTKSFIDNVDRAEPELESNIFRRIFKVEADTDYEDVDPIQRILPKISYWSTSGSSLIQFSENYISDNWYKGGTGSFNLLSVQKLSANYKKNKFKFNNSFEWRMSFYSNLSKSDSLGMRIGEDVFRTYSDFGIQAINNWSYSTNLEIKTQVFRNYSDETNEMISAPFSPININMGILGMKYSLDRNYTNNRHKKLKLSADISPLSIQYTYVANKKVDPIRYGIEEGKRYLLDLGSTINANISIHFNRQVSFSSRFKYFTSYHKVIVESENELNLALSRFFSTRLYVYARFDDTSPETKTDNWGYFQLNEVFSFGFNYKW